MLTIACTQRDCRLPQRGRWALRSSGLLRSEWW